MCCHGDAEFLSNCAPVGNLSIEQQRAQNRAFLGNNHDQQWIRKWRQRTEENVGFATSACTGRHTEVGDEVRK